MTHGAYNPLPPIRHQFPGVCVEKTPVHSPRKTPVLLPNSCQRGGRGRTTHRCAVSGSVLIRHPGWCSCPAKSMSGKSRGKPRRLLRKSFVPFSSAKWHSPAAARSRNTIQESSKNLAPALTPGDERNATARRQGFGGNDRGIPDGNRSAHENVQG